MEFIGLFMTGIARCHLTGESSSSSVRQTNITVCSMGLLNSSHFMNAFAFPVLVVICVMNTGVSILVMT